MEQIAQNQSDDKEIGSIGDQVVASGKDVNINLGKFFSSEEGEELSYSIENLPESMSMDPNTGIITGTAPETEVNQSQIVNITATNSVTGLFHTQFFRLDVIGTLMLDTPEAKAFFGLEESSFWDTAIEWEIKQFIQQLINEHFVWISVYDAADRPTTSGELISRHKAQSGWEILNFENVIMITPGEEKAFEQGNRGRLLETLREVYNKELPKKNWKVVDLGGSDEENIGKAWMVATVLGVPLYNKDEAPTYAAMISYANIQRVNEVYPPRNIQPPQAG